MERIHENMLLYGSPFTPHQKKMGRPRRITPAQEQSLVQVVEQQPWAQQAEMVRCLWEEWQLPRHQSTMYLDVVWRACYPRFLGGEKKDKERVQGHKARPED